MRTPLWLSIALFMMAIIVFSPAGSAANMVDRQQTMATARSNHVPEVASPTDLTVATRSTNLSTQRTLARGDESNIGAQARSQEKSDLPCWRNAIAVGDESGMGFAQPVAEIWIRGNITMQQTPAPQLALSGWRNENSGTYAFGVLKIS